MIDVLPLESRYSLGSSSTPPLRLSNKYDTGLALGSHLASVPGFSMNTGLHAEGLSLRNSDNAETLRAAPAYLEWSLGFPGPFEIAGGSR